MTKRLAKRLTPLMFLVAVVFTGGCKPQFPPGEEVIFDYLRKAPIEGRVRRAWPAGQAYLDKVLKARAALLKEMEPLYALTHPSKLWPHDDPRWQDETQVADLMAELVDLAAGQRKKYEIAARKFAEAIADVPAEFDFAAGDKRTPFLAQVWSSLKYDGQAQQLTDVIASLEGLAIEYGNLAHAVTECKEHLDKTTVGLHFKDDSCQTRVDELHGTLLAQLREGREQAAQEAEKDLLDTVSKRKDVDRSAEKLDYEYYTDKRKYLLGLLEDIPKRLHTQVEKAQDKLKEAQDNLTEAQSEAAGAEGEAAALAQAKLDFHTQYLQFLTAEEAKWKQRVEAIKIRAKEAADS